MLLVSVRHYFTPEAKKVVAAADPVKPAVVVRYGATTPTHTLVV